MTYGAAKALTVSLGEMFPGYSGRGTRGEKTTGVLFENEHEFLSAIAGVMINGSIQEREDVGAWLIQDFHRDNLGKSIIYY